MSEHLLKLAIHATPGAKRTEAAGRHGDALRVRLAAPPVDGKANDALIDWAARAFALPRKQVTLLHGAASRQKVLGLQFATEAEIQAARTQIQQWLDAT